MPGIKISRISIYTAQEICLQRKKSIQDGMLKVIWKNNVPLHFNAQVHMACISDAELSTLSIILICSLS